MLTVAGSAVAEAALRVPFVVRVEEPGGLEEAVGASVYYGLNASSSLALEPVDQVDGFLVGKAVQEQVGGRFTALVAGQYECLNALAGAVARAVSRSRSRSDREKKRMLACVLERLGMEGEVLAAADLWEDPGYWELVTAVARDIGPGAVAPRAGLRLGGFPLDALGAAKRVLPRDVINAWSAPGFYVPVEVGEALWLKEKRGVAYKVGPESERMYDRFIRPRGMGIIVLEQPRCLVRAKTDGNGGYRPAQEVEVVPYIGKAGQERVLFSDTLADIGLRRRGCGVSYERAFALAKCYQELAGRGYGGDVQAVDALVRLGGLRG